MSLTEKYPDQYLNHYTSMFQANNGRLNDESIKKHNELYISIEGEEEFKLLKQEAKLILCNNDVELLATELDIDTDLIQKLIKVLID